MNKKTLIALPLSLILILPLSAFAESFTVTTNKDIYSLNDNAIIVGVIPEDAPDGYAVLIKVTGSDGDCASQNILPGADNSFRSKLVKLDKCAVGQFTVSAFYADLKTNSTFTISNSSQADAGSRLELSALKNVMLQALDVVNARVKGLIEDGYVLPVDVANKYSEGVSEASLALQAIEFGDAAEAKKHMIFAIQDFRQVLKELSEENMAKFEQAADNIKSEVVGAYNILQRKYYNLQGVAETNQVDKESQFNAALLLLSNAKRSIDDGNYEDAERRLGQVNAVLEEIRADLYGEEEEQENLASDANDTSQADEMEARKLTETAARYEEDALELLNETRPDSEAEAKVQEALSLVANATASIEAHDFDSARDTLRDAYKAILEAQDLIEEDEDKGDEGNSTSTSNSNESSDNDNSGKSSGNDEDSDNGNSGKDKEDDNENKGSNKGNDDEDDQ